MNSTELRRSDKIEMLEKIAEKAKERYREKTFGKYSCLVNANGEPFRIFAFPGEKAICIEYAESENDAALGRFEDGDRFYLEDFQSLEALTEAVFAEIDS